MYLGLTTRGLHIMVIFFGFIALVSLLRIEELAFLSIPIWFYNFFDSYNYKRALQNDKPVEDKSVLNIDYSKLNYYNVGWGIIVFGILLILKRMDYWFFNYTDISPVVIEWLRAFKSSIIPIGFIIIGFIMIKKGKKRLFTD